MKKVCEQMCALETQTVPIIFLGLLNTVQGISNIAFFCEQNGLVEIPNYQTLTNALDSIIDLEGFNNLYADFFDILDLSKRYDSTRPTLVYQGMRGADGEFPLMVSRLTPIIGDGVETARSQTRMSDQDLTYTFRNQEGGIIRTEFAQKKLKNLKILLNLLMVDKCWLCQSAMA